MTEPAYYNIHGQPLALSAKDAALAREPLAYAECERGWTCGDVWKIKRATEKRGRHFTNELLGTGLSEEAAWREALSRMRVADDEEVARA